MKRIAAVFALTALLATSAFAQSGAPRVVTTPTQNKAMSSGTTGQSTPRLDTDKDPHKAEQSKDAAKREGKEDATGSATKREDPAKSR